MKKLRIGTYYLRYVAGNKDRIDALAFAILIKQRYRSSVVRNATYRKLKSEFGIGQAKLRKLIDCGLRCGFLRYEGNNLIANPIQTENRYVYIVRRKWFYEKRNRKGRLTVSGVRSIIEEAIVVNQISMQQDCGDTHRRVTDGKSIRSIRNAKRRESRMLRKPYCEDYTGLSNNRIQALIGRKHGKACKAVKSAIAHKQITRFVRVESAGLAGDPCNLITKSYIEDARIIVWMATRSAYIRFSNVYDFKGRNITMISRKR